MKNAESVLFPAFLDSGLSAKPIGPSLPNLRVFDASKAVWILYGPFVAPEARWRGVGEALMNRACQLAQETGADSLILETDKDNHTAQKLYERLGYVGDGVFYRYTLQL